MSDGNVKVVAPQLGMRTTMGDDGFSESRVT
jgi:hypothetical protein